jgi:hypothetical protein
MPTTFSIIIEIGPSADQPQKSGRTTSSRMLTLQDAGFASVGEYASQIV